MLPRTLRYDNLNRGLLFQKKSLRTVRSGRDHTVWEKNKEQIWIKLDKILSEEMTFHDK